MRSWLGLSIIMNNNENNRQISKNNRHFSKNYQKNNGQNWGIMGSSLPTPYFTMCMYFSCVPLIQSAPSPQLRAAAVDCLCQLTQQLGRNIVRGRVEQHNPT